MDTPALVVLIASLLAALVAALGVLPLRLRGAVHRSWVQSAQAIAGGLMLGAGYVLAVEGLRSFERPLLLVLGMFGGGLYTFFVQTYAGIDESTAPSRRAVLRQSLLHGSMEGVAIGAASVVDLNLGLVLAGALALHNIAEALILSSHLRRLGVPGATTMSLAVLGKLGQPALAVITFLIGRDVAGFESAVLGFGAGSLVFLVIAELLPTAYHPPTPSEPDDDPPAQDIEVRIALLISLATAAVIVFEEMLR
ncbi:MAG: hypothetical protein AAGD38_05520 [Acidobacteriota bacterium]